MFYFSCVIVMANSNQGPRFVPVPDLEDDYIVEDDEEDYQM